ncbi:nuclear transcription factor Y subunit B-4-like [Cynara cardunculus var. scolymus]|uniref:Transcription factor CBF/NF-Y/archaeal histone domain-containing protein n=1 Tax=Cynara cardunculus var. scolymus TaxID=59895 RepID=A0A103Y3C5_CYNCS|nr:nuclear transcription factor Y subunit B-4-like [Cynara cardunculus var. scolymus]KVI01746.1 hypothetical protein Ccrd_019975 [Cynara cardunculus var. scolymus]
MVDEHDKLLPVANVGRIMKRILPPTAKISKEAKETIQECASEFISFVTGEASDKCHKENRKTVNGDDICWALGSLGFDDYSQAIGGYLHKHREFERERASAAAASSSAALAASNQIQIANSIDQATVGCKGQLSYPANSPLEFRSLMEKGQTSHTEPL